VRFIERVEPLIDYPIDLTRAENLGEIASKSQRSFGGRVTCLTESSAVVDGASSDRIDGYRVIMLTRSEQQPQTNQLLKHTIGYRRFAEAF
jgi:hypothetical protein